MVKPTSLDLPKSWRDRLSAGDKDEVFKWVVQSGLERVARIVDVLADANGERGRTVYPDSVLLMLMAKNKLRDRSRGNHSLAAEAASKAGMSGRPGVSVDGLTDKLRNNFTRRQYAWTLLASHSTSSGQDNSRYNRPPSHNENRILGRIIDILPEELNLYAALLTDTARLHPEKVALVERFGRKRAESLMIKRISEINDPGSTKATTIPRSFYDLIAPELEEFAAAQ